jgi:2-oxoglutarate ferredoxin oxidoreductase subunit delta
MKDKKDSSLPEGRVIFKIERCKGCGFCIEFCPVKVLEFSDQYNNKGYPVPEIKFPENCIGCNFCGRYCPDFAIWGEKAEGEDDDEC